MGRTCYYCNKNASENPTASLHLFPKDTTTRFLWIKACKLLLETDDVSRLYLCSDHFQETDYINRVGGKYRLKSGAVPFSSSLKSGVVKTEPALDIAGVFIDPSGHVTFSTGFTKLKLAEISLDNPQDDFGDCPVMPIKRKERDDLEDDPNLLESDMDEITENAPKSRFIMPHYAGNLTPEHFNTPESVRRNLGLLKDTVRKKDLQIRKLQQQNRDLKKKIDKYAKVCLGVRKPN